jgi:hypothetical protein
LKHSSLRKWCGKFSFNGFELWKIHHWGSGGESSLVSDTLIQWEWIWYLFNRCRLVEFEDDSWIQYFVKLFSDMQKFPLRMKDNDLLVTELYKDPSSDSVTALSVYLTPKTSKYHVWNFLKLWIFLLENATHLCISLYTCIPCTGNWRSAEQVKPKLHNTCSISEIWGSGWKLDFKWEFSCSCLSLVPYWIWIQILLDLCPACL